MNTSIIAAILALTTSLSITSTTVPAVLHGQSITDGVSYSIATNVLNADISQGESYSLPVDESPLSSPIVVDEDHLPTTPTTSAEFHAVWDYVVKHDSDEVSFSYHVPCTEEVKNNIAQLIKETSSVYRYAYPEKFNYRRVTGYVYRDKSDAGFTLTVCFAPVDSTVSSDLRNMANDKATEVYTELRNSGALTDTMTEQERAWAILNWLAANTTYLDTQNALCHTAYSVFELKSGVCDAYTAAYQTLLRLDGIACYGVKGYIKENNELHSWSKVFLDGQWLNVDACGCDAGDHAVKSLFAITDETLSITHKWN